MTFSLRDLVDLVALTLRNPRQAARHLLQVAGEDRDLRWMAVALVACLATIFVYVTLPLVPIPMRYAMKLALPAPVATAVIQGVMLILGAAIVQWASKLAGGRGRLDQVIIVMAWLGFLRILLQVVMLACGILAPAATPFIAMIGISIVLWVFAGLVAEVQGFRSQGAVFVVAGISLYVLTYLAQQVLLAALTAKMV